MASQSVQICGGVLTDDNGSTPYSDNFYTMTICPEIQGEAISLFFDVFSLQSSLNSNNSDFLAIYDGSTTASDLVGVYTGSSLQNISITATTGNPSGCLTLVFEPGGVSNIDNDGFQADISCTLPCDPPMAQLNFFDPVPEGEGCLRICPGEEVSFSGQESFSGGNTAIAFYDWIFSDSLNEQSAESIVTKTYYDPGQYFISLVVSDENGCQSSVSEPLCIQVSTAPEFSEIQQIQDTYCFGEEIILDAGNTFMPSWVSLPNQAVSGETFLPDGEMVMYNSAISFDFFDEGAVLENCNDLNYVFVNMEHSFMNDLGISITCPNGTSIDLVEWGTNGGGGTLLGEPVDIEWSSEPGIGYNYYWSPIASNGTWGENAAEGSSLPGGVYEASDDMCDLIGCPLNGTWNFSVTDHLWLDNGYIFQWGLNFNPDILSNVSSFTPVIGLDSDSSYWSGPFLEDTDGSMDVVSIEYSDSGIYEYSYHVINNFGCSYDTTISISITPPPAISLGDDIVYGCEPVLLEGNFLDVAFPSCSIAEGEYTYCYDDNSSYTVTYCPDNPGDGISFIQLDFSQGSVEGDFSPFDPLSVYDGPDTSSPIIVENLSGDLSGFSWIATNPSGCLTINLMSDVSVSCTTGNETPWVYSVGCPASAEHIWTWTPPFGLSNPSGQSTLLENLNQTTTYTLSHYTEEHPDCISVDSILISAPSPLILQSSVSDSVCPGEAIHLDVSDISGGVEPYAVEWSNENGEVIPENDLDIIASDSAVYCVRIEDNCQSLLDTCFSINIFSSVFPEVLVEQPNGCQPLWTTFYLDPGTLNHIQQISWNFGDGTQLNSLGSVSHEYAVPGYYWPQIEVLDENGCLTATAISDSIEVWPIPEASFSANPEVAQLPNTTIEFHNESSDATIYHWFLSDQDSSILENPIFTFPLETQGIYTVELFVENDYGCKDSAIMEVIIEDNPSLYIPNAFTPNHDGINDVWMMEGSRFSGQNFIVQIFNRWGELVFESTDPNIPWTGNYREGNSYVPDGVYIYKIVISMPAPQSSRIFEGHINLLR
ncbi:MAG: gliding motility-associated C-terminal domain-containing protein [Crocinitomicaceae bacterium]|nr:gliding motility-associated C-terminal domain-containing protein [Crocinitomicaceae bacterium]